MMMTKPAPQSAASATDATKKKASPEDAVKDLEKRLQMLERTKPAAAPTAFAAAPASAAVAAAAPKNALLARIMAAQEKAKQGPTTAPPPAASAPPDLLDSFDTPAESESAPPPPFDVSLLPPQQEAPPAFDASLLPPPPEQQSTPDVWDHRSMMTMSSPAPAASAPVFEDLLDNEEEQQQKLPPSYSVTPVAPPVQAGLDQDAIDAILGIEGLSDQEKADLIAEQERIMASIEAEQKKKQTPSARADAFEQRSHAAAVQAIGGGSNLRTIDLGDGNAMTLHGQNKTREAIKDGTAVIVQCLSCDSWMQVTGNATMMFCPNCQTVSPVATAEDKAAASQLAADMELAEQLQKEEYKMAEKRQAKAAAAKTSTSSPKAAKQPEPESSWMEWLGFGTPAPAPGTKPEPPSFAQKPLSRGEIGTSLPPGASRNNTALAMAPAYTGTDDDEDTMYDAAAPRIRFSPSKDGGMGDMPEDTGGARVAKSQPLFSCVADSINSAASSLYHTVAADTEGNVHGVDTSGLLAISQAGRNQPNNNSGSSYQAM